MEPVTQSDIDPRLQEAVSGSQAYPNAAPSGSDPSQYRLPPHPPSPFQPQHQHQRRYEAPPPQPQWPQGAFNAYYAPPGQHQPPIVQVPQHAPHAYQAYHDPSGHPVQPHWQASLSETTDPKRPRACEACRNLKVRCEPDPHGGKCKRCEKADRNCFTTAPSRKRQKKPDNRVTELERKIDALTRTLKSTKEGNVNDSDEDIDGGDDTAQNGPMGGKPFQQVAHPASAPRFGQKRDYSEYLQDAYPATHAPNLAAEAGQRSPSYATRMVPEAQMGPPPTSVAPKAVVLPEDGLVRQANHDVVGRGLLEAVTANELFVHYTKSMAPHMPLVVFPQDVEPETVQKSSPILFLAILSVASGQKNPDLQGVLKKEIMSILVDRILNGSSKTLEILQALQVVIIWYLPECGKDSQYYQFVHMALGLAIDLGINKKPEAKRQSYSALRHNSSTIDTETVECRRAWLGSYLLYSSIAMGMRRPNLIRNDGYLQECMTQLRLSESALNSDKLLCDLVYLQTLADNLSEQILPDHFVAISEIKARSAYREFETQKKGWEEQNAESMGLLPLLLTLNVINLYMHELVMQHVASLEPGKPPSRSRAKGQAQLAHSPQDSLSIALTSTLAILDAFPKFTHQEIRTLPTLYFAQIAHASVSLIKLYFVAQADSEISKHAPVTVDMVEGRLSGLSGSLRAACSESLGAYTCLQMILTIQGLFEEHKNSTLASIKAHYSGIPSLQGTQMLDLKEPQPTPQHRTAPRDTAETADDALHLLSSVAMEKSNANGYEEGGPSAAPNGAASTAIDSERATMGQLIGEGEMGFMSDEGFMGIMQQMWARSTGHFVHDGKSEGCRVGISMPSLA